MTTDSTDGTTDESPPPTEADDATNEQIRERRLDPENRPDGAEVDNTERTFDEKRGMFTDSPDYDSADELYLATGEEEDTSDDS